MGNKEIRKKRAEIIAEKSKELKPIEKKYKVLEEKKLIQKIYFGKKEVGEAERLSKKEGI